MRRNFITGVLGLLAFAAQAQNPQVLYATLQLAQQPAQFLSLALKPAAEPGKGFFLVTENSIQVGRARYVEVAAGSVKTGSTIALKGTDGRFLGCCSQGGAALGSTAAASQMFIVRFYTAADVAEFQARAAQNSNTAAAFSGLDADDGAGK